MCSSTSVVSCNCCLGSTERVGASNLLSLFDKRSTVDVNFSLVDKSGELVGRTQQHMETEIARPSDKLTELRGTVDINMDIPVEHPSLRKLQQNMKGYVVYLRQVDKGVIEGVTAYPYFGGDSDS